MIENQDIISIEEQTQELVNNINIIKELAISKKEDRLFFENKSSDIISNLEATMLKISDFDNTIKSTFTESFFENAKVVGDIKQQLDNNHVSIHQKLSSMLDVTEKFTSNIASHLAKIQEQTETSFKSINDELIEQSNSIAKVLDNQYKMNELIQENLTNQTYTIAIILENQAKMTDLIQQQAAVSLESQMQIQQIVKWVGEDGATILHNSRKGIFGKKI